MIFNEALYPLFLALSVLVFYLIPVSWRSWWLFLTGLVFYAYYAEIFVYLFIVEAAIVFVLMKQYRKNLGVFVSVLVLCILLLVYFKYKNMLLIGYYSTLDIFTGQGLPTFQKMMFPLAISFFTFEFIHYVVDLYKGKIGPHSFKDFMGFIMFFPTMVAGPIKRFQEFVPQIANIRFSWADINAGSIRILIGTGKKVIIADSMDLWLQPLQTSAGLSGASGLDLWIALFAYSIKIYADFSGYSDIAIGSGRLFGIHIPENFNWPYLRPNIAQFWRHWHISLTRWITEYVYISLGGARTSFQRVLVNIVLAMAISGIWHGAEWHFLFWGLWHGLMLVGHRVFREKIAPKLPWLDKYPWVFKPFFTLLTFTLVTLGWGLFIMPLESFLQILPRLVGLKG